MNGNEPEVVLSWQLANAIKAFVHKWNAERPRSNYNGESPGASKRTIIHPMSPYAWLEQETKIGERRLRAIVNCETVYTSLTLADRIVSAMGAPELFGSEIHVIPNPRMSQETYLERMRERGCV